MTRTEDGITLKMPVLISLLSACLIVGVGSTWLVSGQTLDPSIRQDISALQKNVGEHHQVDAARDSAHDIEIKALQKQYDKIEAKLDEANKRLDILLRRRCPQCGVKD